MEGKLQEKFALLQQMKRDKELKEAKIKDNQPIDIFALAGVNLPSTSSGLGAIRTEQHGTGKRPQVDRSNSASQNQGSAPGNVSRRPSQPSTVVTSGGESERIDDAVTSPKVERKLKRSSMAARGGAQPQGKEDSRRGSQDYATSSGRGRQLSVCSVTSSDSTSTHALVESPVSVAPLTPISPPGSESTVKNDSQEEQQSVQRVRDMTRNVHSRTGSMDENEEMILDVYGRSVPRSRRQSSDDGSDYGNGDRYGGQEGGHDNERHQRPNHRTETDPYVVASRYLDIAFYPTKVYVGNLPDSVSLTSLRTAFKPFGDIEDMNLVEGKDFGFVTYKEPSAARSALEKMNGASLDGATIRVNRAKIPERNRHGFAGVAWTDEDGDLARIEEEQHKQAAAVAGTVQSRESGPGVDPSVSGPSSSVDTNVSYGTRPSSDSGSTARPVHALPQRPRSPKLPPKPSMSYPPVGTDPRAAIAARSGGRQILTYDDL
ncbi:RNA-binding protein 39 [Mortierella sp. GBA43]|nr:RNA-binding protein 39 [Mortierella sp. GBA43]